MDYLIQFFAILKGNVVPALIVLTAVVFVHEMGHFLVARLCGIKVAAFSVGFGQEIIGRTDRRGTRWRLSAIPLGGYVRFEGDENAASVPDMEELEATPLAEREGLFHFAPLWKRFAVVVAGPLANFILAVLVFATLFALFGRPYVPPVVGAVEAGTPAEQAGFQAGDRILSVDGSSVASFTDLQDIVMLSAGDTLTVLVSRDGHEDTIVATPKRREMKDFAGRTHVVPVLGIKSAPSELKRDGPLEAVAGGVGETLRIIDRTLAYLKQVVVGRESPAQLSGLIGIGQVSGAVASDGGVTGLIYLTAVLSVSIGLFNLFPIPMLDGGHILFYIFEGIRGRPLSPRVQDIGFRIGFALVIMLFIFVTFNDIANLPGLFTNS